MYIDTAAKQFEEDTAKKLLEEIYFTYLKRQPDETGLAFYLPVIKKYGFLGYIFVVDSVIHSTEMKEVYTKELQEIWNRNFSREPDIEELNRYKDLVLFYRHAGRVEIQNKITRAGQITLQASVLNAKNDPNKSAEAEQLITNVIDKGIAGSWQIWHEFGLAHFRQERFDKAISAYHKAISLNPDHTWLWSCEDLKWCYEGLAKLNHDKLKEGLEYFLRVVEQFPERWIAWHECGYLAWKIKDYLNAVNYYHEAIERSRGNLTWAWSATDLMSCYKDAGLGNNAYEYFVVLTQSQPKKWGNWHARAWTEWNLKNHDGNAISSYQKAVETHPEGGWVWSWNDLGFCFFEKEQYIDAYNAFKQASDKEPTRKDIWHSLARVSKRLRKWDNAFLYLSKSIGLDQNYSPTWQSLGNYYLDKTEPEYLLAWLAYKKSLRLSPGNREIISRIEHIENRHRSDLRKFLHASFDKSEFKILCYDIGLNYDDLSGDTLSEKQISLIDKCFNLGKEDQLIIQIQIERQDKLPNIFHSQFYKLT